MTWFLIRDTWAKKVKLKTGRYKTLTSGVKSSRVPVKWKDEKKRVTVEAERIIQKRIVDEGIFDDVDEVFDTLFDQAVAQYKQNFNFNEYHLKKIEAEFSGKMMEDISVLDIQRFHNKILERCKPTTWNRYRNVLNAIFNRAIEWKMCSHNPVKAVKRYPDSPVEVFITHEQAETLLREARKYDFYLYVYLVMALKTGRRKSEILAITWDDVDFDNRQIRYRILKKKEGAKVYVRKAPECVFETLALLKKIHPDRPFPYFPRKPWQRVRDKVQKAVGLDDHRFHGLRHRCATEIIEKDGTLHDVQFYLCHSSPLTSNIYAHVSDERERKIVEKLER